MAPVTCLTFFLEIGRLLPVPATQIVSYGDRTPAWAGWTPHLLSRMMGADDPPTFTEETIPRYRLAFRHGLARIGSPLYSAEIVYEDWIDPLFSEEVNATRRAERDACGPTLAVYQSFVAITRYVPESEHPDGESLTVRWLTDAFREGLNVLNQLLDHLSFATGQWAVAAVERRDLPAILPLLLQSTHLDEDGQIRGSRGQIPLHGDFPHLEQQGPPEASEDAIVTAVAITTEGNRGEQPFEPTFRFLRAANSEVIAGDSTRSIIDLNTAMELLISQLISAGGLALGWPAERINRANRVETGLKNRVQHHLGALVGASIDVNDETTTWGAWWSQGYMARNRAVHQGVRLTDADVRRAWLAASNLITHVQTVLQLQADLEPMAAQLAALSMGAEPPWLDAVLQTNADWF